MTIPLIWAVVCIACLLLNVRIARDIGWTFIVTLAATFAAFAFTLNLCIALARWS